MRRSRLAAVGLAAATLAATAVSLVLGAPSATAA